MIILTNMKKYVLTMYGVFLFCSLMGQDDKSKNENENTPDTRKNIVSIDPILPFQSSIIGVAYEMFNKSGNVGYKIPLNIGYKDFYFEYGLDMKFYLWQSKPSHFYLGPLSLGNSRLSYFLGPSTSLIHQNKAPYFLTSHILFTNGITFQSLNSGLYLSLNGYGGAAIFLKYDETKVVKKNFKKVTFLPGIGIDLGWRF